VNWPVAYQPWVEDWRRPGEPPPDAVEWIRSRPECLHVTMRAFPPNCVVRAKVPLRIPAVGTCGIVTTYLAPNDVFVGVRLTVRQTPSSVLRAECYPADLEVVGYWRGLTPEFIDKVLA
jgi:hypothetical protein